MKMLVILQSISHLSTPKQLATAVDMGRSPYYADNRARKEESTRVMRSRRGRYPSVLRVVALCSLTGLAAAFGGTGLSEEKDSTERGSAGPLRAPLYPTERTYPLATIEGAADSFPTVAAWKRALRAHTFLHEGRPEPEDRRTSLRMLRGAGVLYARVECPTAVSYTHLRAHET